MSTALSCQSPAKDKLWQMSLLQHGRWCWEKGRGGGSDKGWSRLSKGPSFASWCQALQMNVKRPAGQGECCGRCRNKAQGPACVRMLATQVVFTRNRKPVRGQVWHAFYETLNQQSQTRVVHPVAILLKFRGHCMSWGAGGGISLCILIVALSLADPRQRLHATCFELSIWAQRSGGASSKAMIKASTLLPDSALLTMLCPVG